MAKAVLDTLPKSGKTVGMAAKLVFSEQSCHCSLLC